MAVLLAEEVKITLLAVMPLGVLIRPGLRKRWRRRREMIHENYGLTIDILPSIPTRFKRLWSDRFILRLWLILKGPQDEHLVVHCRGHEATLLASGIFLRRKNVYVLYDCRGLSGAEFAFLKGYPEVDKAPSAIANVTRQIESSEREAARKADGMICVSEAMKKYVFEHWSVPESKVVVVPCCSDIHSDSDALAHREKSRHELNLEKKFVVSYCGSLESWQAPKESLVWFKRILSMRADAHFLAITTHPARMECFVKEARISEAHYTIRSVPQPEVFKLLAAADCGLLVRKPSVVNRVASPVKFAEYLAAGVPVLISEGVGDYSALVEIENLGLVLPHDISDHSSESLLSRLFRLIESEGQYELAKRCRTYAMNHFGWNQVSQKIEMAYQKVANRA